MSTFDFIVVGAGPAGCTVASRLSRSAKRPSVLMVEAGSANAAPDLKVDGERWLTMMQNHMNYKYQTVPQNDLANREISYDRGKGLGGSSAINFSVYNVGAKDDFDTIARITSDPDWCWDAIQKRFIALESFHTDEVDSNLSNYLQPKSSDHGSSGLLEIGFPKKVERALAKTLDICVEAGHPLNLDLNSGNPIGFGVPASSAFRGVRSTAADLLKDATDNLTIVKDAVVHKILFDGNAATGIQTESGEKYLASKEVILCAGSIDSPKLLLLSGVGPADHLSKMGIPVVSDLSLVGHGLKDHNHSYMIWRRKPEWSARPAHYRDPEAILKAKEQWKFDGTGPLAELGICLGIGYLKSDAVSNSPEFHALPQEVKAYLSLPTIPSFEIIANAPDLRDLVNPAGSESSACFFVMLMNPQSEGYLELKSANPADPPVIDPKAFSHPYDHRVVIEGIKTLLSIVDHPSFAKDTIGAVDAPQSSSDEDILDFWRQKAGSTWHPTSTIQIDNTLKGRACVDKSLRVHGTEKLRIGDLSVLPLIPNCHTQSTAYVAGATLGDKLAKEYGLDA